MITRRYMSEVFDMLKADLGLNVILVAFLLTQSLVNSTGMQFLIVGALCAIMATLLYLNRRRSPKTESKDEWKQYRRDRITEEERRPWSKTLIAILGQMVAMSAAIAYLFLALLIVMTTGSYWHLMLAYALIFVVRLLGLSLTIAARRLCRYCKGRLDVIHESVNAESGWLVCYQCKYRALALGLESEESGD